MSPPEARMWSLLRLPPFKVLHFRRQMQIGPYYADFASFRAKLVIEVDDAQHLEDAAQIYDAQRTRFIEAQGYRVLRFSTIDVLQALDGVYAAILDAASPPE